VERFSDHFHAVIETALVGQKVLLVDDDARNIFALSSVPARTDGESRGGER
jgi:hypothetical protein